jgi:hypothetical protein
MPTVPVIRAEILHQAAIWLALCSLPFFLEFEGQQKLYGLSEKN